MITNKDIRVENGFLIINGDKFPLDGQSPEAIMQIVEDNSDTTPTENSTAPITSGGVFAADKDITDTIGDITQTGVTGATVAAQITTLAGAITYTDITINKNTTGHAAPVQSAGGVYYEALATYTALGVTKDKILNIILVDWHDTVKNFNYYLGSSGIGVLTDSVTSIYNETPTSDLTLRIVHES